MEGEAAEVEVKGEGPGVKAFQLSQTAAFFILKDQDGHKLIKRKAGWECATCPNSSRN